jgi:hypothetical protein
LLPVLLLVAASTLAPDRETKHFEFYFRGTGAAAHTALVEEAEAVAARVTRDLGTRWPSRTRVVVAGSAGDFAAALPAGADLGEGVVGVAFPDERLIVLRNVPELRQVFVHEASHIALYGAAPRTRLPRWFVEGFAAHQSGEGSFGRLSSLVRASVSGRLIPLADLERRFPARHDAADLAYAQSAELVSYLLGTYGHAALRELLQRLRRGEPFFDALSQAYHTSLGDLEKAYLRDIRIRYNWVPILTGPLTLWMGITLIFLVAYWRKRRAMKRRLAEMAEDEGGDGGAEIVELFPGREDEGPPDEEKH